MMRRMCARHLFPIFLAAPLCAAQEPAVAPSIPATSTASAQVRNDFHIRYINGTNVYIDAGRDAGLAEGTKLVLKQDPSKPSDDPANKALEAGVVAKLSVVAVASTSAVCEVVAT